MVRNIQKKVGRPKTPRRKYTNPYPWTWKEDVQLVNLLKTPPSGIGATNRWPAVHNYLKNQLKWQNPPAPEAIKRHWLQNLIDPKRSRFWKPYSIEEDERLSTVPENASEEAIKRSEAARMQAIAQNAETHAKCKAAIQEISNREIVASSAKKDNTKALKQQHLDQEAEAKRTRRNRFEESQLRAEQEAKDRHENSVFLRNAHDATFGLNHIATLAANHAAVVTMMSVYDKSEKRHEELKEEAEEILSLMQRIRTSLLLEEPRKEPEAHMEAEDESEPEDEDEEGAEDETDFEEMNDSEEEASLLLARRKK